jgi:hypothetical protein
VFAGGARKVVRAERRDGRGGALATRREPPPPYTAVRCFRRVGGTPLGEPETNPRGFDGGPAS